MQYYRCKCGVAEFWGSGMAPASCQGCEKCNTTLAQHPADHKTPEPHDCEVEWRINRVTGERRQEKVCKRCRVRFAVTSPLVKGCEKS